MHKYFYFCKIYSIFIHKSFRFVHFSILFLQSEVVIGSRKRFIRRSTKPGGGVLLFASFPDLEVDGAASVVVRVGPDSAKRLSACN